MIGTTIVEPRFISFALPNAPLEKLGEGFRWFEGRAWFTDLQGLLVSDLPNDRIGGGFGFLLQSALVVDGGMTHARYRGFSPAPRGSALRLRRKATSSSRCVR